MPHVNLHYFECFLSDSQKEQLVTELMQTISKVLGCSDEVISISLCPEQPEQWQQKIVEPYFLNASDKLVKFANY
ncbi:indigoidine synthase IndC [Pseudoalteromonas fenneropenaei]|uniref:Indigoidine synthase IndC n=1 Tax=Pseudoalteromonas fenneropenaei TaxID=1737459 RepID=A0ABV7CM44_9GAMM